MIQDNADNEGWSTFFRKRSNPNLNINPTNIKDEKKDKCSAMIQTDKQWRAKSEQEKLIHQGKERVTRGNKERKIRSWNKYCTTTSPNNPWKGVHKLAYNKTRSKQIILQKSDRTKTETIKQILQLMLDQLIPEDNQAQATTWQFGSKENNHYTPRMIMNLQRKKLGHWKFKAHGRAGTKWNQKLNS